MTVITFLQSTLNDSPHWTDTSPEWGAFIDDYRDLIIGQSNYVPVTAQHLVEVRQDVPGMIRKIAGGLDTRCAWIVMRINRLATNMDLTEPMNLYIPRENDIQALYAKYQTSRRINRG